MTDGITIIRRYDAPREDVFRAWTEPEHLEWFANPGHGPRKPTTVDLRVGGEWRLHMIENEDKQYITGGVYREIVRPERLVFTWGAVDGWPAYDPAKPDECPLCTITLTDLGDDTTEMVFHCGFPGMTDEQVDRWMALGIRGGWTETIDRLSIVRAGR